MWFDDKKDTGKPTVVTSYSNENRLATKFKNFLSTKSPGWREPNIKEAIGVAVTNQLTKILAVPEKSCKYVSKHPIMGRKLVLKLK